MLLLFRVVLPFALFAVLYWSLGAVAFFRLPGWPRTLRWGAALFLALWSYGMTRAVR